MCAIVMFILILLAPVNAGVLSNVLPEAEGDSQGEERLSEVAGRASFSRVGAVAVPSSYEPVVVDVVWADVYQVMGVAQREMTKLLNHSKVDEDDRRKLSRVEMQCLVRASKKVAQIQQLVQHKKQAKRGVLEILGNLLSLGLGMSNRHLVHELEGRENTLYHNQVEERRLMEKTRNITAAALTKLQEEYDLIVVQESMTELCHDLEQYLERIVNSVYAAFEGRVTPAMLTPEDLEKLSKSVEKKMKK